MMEENKKFTRLTIEQPDFKVIWEKPYEDVDIYEMLDAFNTLMLGITFTQKTVYSGMANWLNEHADEYYIVYDVNNCDKESD